MSLKIKQISIISSLLVIAIGQIKKYFCLLSSGAQWAECNAKVIARDSGLETKDLSTGRAIGGV